MFSQGNTVYTTTVGAPGQSNVLFGNTNTGASISSSAPNPAFNNVFVGDAAGKNTFRIDPYALFSDSGSYNTFVGNNSGILNTQGRMNSFFGYNSGNGNTTGAYNVLLGHNSSNKSGDSNVMVGYGTGNINNIGGGNVFLGYSSGLNHASGNSNVFIGYTSSVSNGDNNIVLGNMAGSSTATINCSKNIFIGYQAGNGLTSGASNTLINAYGGASGLTTGVGNTFLGPVVTSNNNLQYTFIYADPGSNQRLYIHNNGNTGIGLGNNIIPQNKLEIKSDATNSSGLRFTNLPNTVTPITNPTNGVLSLNSTGDVIWVKDIGGGVTNSCLTNYNIPVNNGTGNLSCGQIYDNGSSVSIGSPLTSASALSYNTYGMATTTTGYTTGNLKLFVNGVTQGLVFISSSDKKFKKNIAPIKNALTTIQAIDGKTYDWNKESNKDMNFDSGSHSGFIAQELEKVLPHLVVTNEKGEKGVNYIELIPYLVEAIKEQQNEISDLKAQLSESFKTQNQDLIELNNTKIINVSPNPSNDIITISLNIENSVQSAKLQIYDLNGNIISSLLISDRDNNITRTLQKNNFGKGTYIVSLLINGKSIDSKKIIFN